MFALLKHRFTLTGDNLKTLLGGAYQRGYRAALHNEFKNEPTGEGLLALIKEANSSAEERIGTLVAESACSEDQLYGNPALPEGPTGVTATVTEPSVMDLLGHSIHIRKPRKADDPRTGGFGDLDNYDVAYEDVAMVVMGEDLGVCLLLAISHEGDILFREDMESPQILDLYYVAACAANQALQLSQKSGKTEHDA